AGRGTDGRRARRWPVRRNARRGSRGATGSPGGGSPPLPRLHREERVGADAEAKRLEGDDVGEGDVAEIHVRAEALHEVRLQRLRGGLEDEVVEHTYRLHDLLDQPDAQLAGGTADAARASFARLGDHLDGAGGEILEDVLHPLSRIHILGLVAVLESDFAEDAEVVREIADMARLLVVGHGQRAVGDLDVAAVPALQEFVVAVELPLVY